MNRKLELRRWSRWLVGSFIVALLSTQLVPPATTQAQSSDGHSIYLPSVVGDTKSEASLEVQEEVPGGDLPVVAGEAVAMGPEAEGEVEAAVAQGGSRLAYTVGGADQVTQYCLTVAMPSFLLDYDGGRIRMIMQHERDGYDQLRMVELFVGHEWTNNSYGNRGRYPGRYGWARQAGGGEYAWILGDNAQSTLANPWNWATIHDFWPGKRTVLGGNNIALCSHPHVTTRFIFYDQ